MIGHIAIIGGVSSFKNITSASVMSFLPVDIDLMDFTDPLLSGKMIDWTITLDLVNKPPAPVIDNSFYNPINGQFVKINTNPNPNIPYTNLLPITQWNYFVHAQTSIDI